MTKLSKLLYFLDFTHFRETSYPSIGLKYYAFRNGPVPKELWLEMKDGVAPEDFKGKLSLVVKRDESGSGFKELEIRAAGQPDDSVFSPRELGILKKLSYIFRDARAWAMSEVSHLPRQPWDTTIKESGENGLIDYLLSVDERTGVSLDYADVCLREHLEVVRNLDIEPTKQR
ncbi:MAG: SocA family protein [Chloroflexi bacterium]|nr:SocA family protein [Chloroflexota bacterium]